MLDNILKVVGSSLDNELFTFQIHSHSSRAIVSMADVPLFELAYEPTEKTCLTMTNGSGFWIDCTEKEIIEFIQEVRNWYCDLAAKELQYHAQRIIFCRDEDHLVTKLSDETLLFKRESGLKTVITIVGFEYSTRTVGDLNGVSYHIERKFDTVCELRKHLGLCSSD